MKTKVLICGGGILGLTLARELVSRGYRDIVILEKEGSLGRHASGRNSGVLHAGIYYHPDSLKGRFCLEGNFLLRQYCHEKGLPFKASGKVIVARSEGELSTLEELYRRATANGAEVQWLDERDLQKAEPLAKTYKKALYSAYTAVTDPLAVLKSLQKDLLASGKVEILMNTAFLYPLEKGVAMTTRGKISFDFLINTAGTYADRVAHKFGVGLQYSIIPFKGFYKKLRSEKAPLVRGNIYPVPDIRSPFLGVHFTKSIGGEVYLGPTAIPAFGRENYRRIEGIEWEGLSILLQDGVLFFANPKFRKIALSEPLKYIPFHFFHQARSLVQDLSPEDILPSSKVGIRPQLVDWKSRELVMDFLVLHHENTLHLLNAISPAFTSSMKMAKVVVDGWERDR